MRTSIRMAVLCRVLIIAAIGLAAFGGIAPGALAEDTAGLVSPAAALRPATIKFIGKTNTGVQVTTNFRVRSLRDLRIIVWWGITGAHVQRIHLRAPDGSLYQQFTQAFDTATSLRTASGTPVETAVPVGGTWISEYSLHGTWQVEVYLDGNRTPIATRSLIFLP